MRTPLNIGNTVTSQNDISLRAALFNPLRLDCLAIAVEVEKTNLSHSLPGKGNAITGH